MTRAVRPAWARRVTRLGAVLAVGLLAAGCAIPTQQRPSVIAANHVPFHLLQKHAPATTTTQPLLTSLVPVKIYLLGSFQQLDPVQRLVDSPAPLFSVIASLAVGPTDSESKRGITTAIPTSVRVISVTTQFDVVTVNFNAAFAQIAGGSTELAVSQVVGTVAAQDGADTGVIFKIDGQHTSVPIASGAEVLGPVYALQFVMPTTSTTTTTPTPTTAVTTTTS
jgi:hypothetical protein